VRRTAIPLALLTLLALTLRVLGLQFGLPAVYNPDEVAIMARALSFAKGTLNPHNFLYPTLYFYVLFAWVGSYLALLWITRRVDSLSALERMYFTDPVTIYTAGRTLAVVAGTATVLLLYRFGSRLLDRRAAWAAAVFLAVSPLHVRDSHYIKHDVPATLAIVCAYLAMTRLWQSAAVDEQSPDQRQPSRQPPTRRELLMAGAACGVAFSTHYYCIFLVVPLIGVVVQRSRYAAAAQVWRNLATAGAASAIVFLALSPFIAVEPLTAWRDITANRQIVIDRAVAAGAFAPAIEYLRMLWLDSLGQPVILLALVGIVWMLIVAPARALFLLAFPLPFLAFISNTVPASRYLNPVLPFLALFAGWGLSSICARFSPARVVLAVAIVAAAAPAVVASTRADLFFREADTRTLARKYIETAIPAGTTILVQPYSVPLTVSRPALVEALTSHLGSPEAASTKFQLQLSLNPYPQPAYRVLYLGSGGLDVDKIYVSYDQISAGRGLEELRRRGVAFVVFKRYNTEDPASSAFLAALAREGRLIAAFSPYRPGLTEAEQGRIDPFLHNTDTRIVDALERPGPPLEIWQLNDPG
jgi:hypothetical protein